ncbi:MAG: PAS domain S-box protein, partial [Spirochaetota bacterium]|nr:PAS domain S-box protein [Spirochaetota bacterium]
MKKHKKTILLVEDEALIAAAEAQMLRQWGYEVVTVLDGPAAIETAVSNDIDMVLMDINLGPGAMDGTEAASRILERKDLPIVFLSSHTEPEVVDKTEKITSYGYVVKFSGNTVLEASLKMAFKLYDANQEVKLRREESERSVEEILLRERRLEHVNRVLLSVRNINQIITKDPDKIELLDKTCQLLVETSGYHNAWIVLLDDGKPAEPFFHKGFGKDCFAGMAKQLKEGWLPPCAAKALKTRDIVITANPEKQCYGCPIQSSYAVENKDGTANAGMTARIEHGGKIYGWLNVSVPYVFSQNQEEHDLFKEIIEDIGYSLSKNDILSEKQQAFIELNMSERLLNNVFDSIQDGISILDTDFTIRRTNQIMKKWYARCVPLEGKKCHFCYQNSDTPCDPCPSLRALKSGKTEVDIVPGVPGSAAEWIELYSYPMKNPDTGSVDGVVEFVRDITDRKLAEKRLHESEENLRATLNSIGDAVIATDTSGLITRMNPVAETLTGWSLAEARGRRLTEVFNIINAYTGKQVQSPVDRVLESGQVVGLANHTMLIAKDGARYQIADSGSPIRDAQGAISGVVLVFRDVSEEYRIREELKRNEDRLSKVLIAANDGTWDWNLTTNEVYYDPRYYEMSGYEADEFPHTLDEFQKRIHPEDVNRVMGTADRHLKGEID